MSQGHPWSFLPYVAVQEEIVHPTWVSSACLPPRLADVPSRMLPVVIRALPQV